MLVDSHAHLDSTRYAGELDDILSRAKLAGVGAILSIGIGEGPHEMHQALDIVRKYSGRIDVPQLYASAGIYPHYTHEADTSALAKLGSLLAEPEVIACGEIGLDYYHEGSPHETQKRVFIEQMQIAACRKRPILIHCRPKDGDDQCWDDLLALMEEHWRPAGIGGVLHCFSGNWEQAERSLDLGFLISFAGHTTYPKSGPLREIAAKLPLESILVETDAPFLAPLSWRGQRNESAYVAETAQVIAEARGISPEELAMATTKNFHRLFGLNISHNNS